MATYTTHYGFKKPADSDFYDIGDFNTNMDTMDEIMFSTEKQQLDISKKIGNPTDTTEDTVMGKLNQNKNNGTTYFYNPNSVKEVLVNEEIVLSVTQRCSSHTSTNYPNYYLLARWMPKKDGLVTVKFKIAHGNVTEPFESPSDSSSPGYGGIYIWTGSVNTSKISSMTPPDTKTPIGTVGISESSSYESTNGYFSKLLTMPQDPVTEITYTELEYSIYVIAGIPLPFYLMGLTKYGVRNMYCNYLAICYDE